MRRFRIFPAVALAAVCLLALKGLALLRSMPDSTLVSGVPDLTTVASLPNSAPPASALNDRPETGRALTRARQRIEPLDPDITGATPAKEKKDGKKPEPEPELAPAPAPARAPAPAPAPAPQPVPWGAPVNLDASAPSKAERALLERLGQRREEIEGRAREMDTREQLLRAAEQKLDARVNDLKTLEEKQQSAPDNKEQSQSQALKNLVTMYETMKPKDAAKVFERLDQKVLLSVVQKMNPRKMSEVLAAMSPESAERLTVALATRGDGAETNLSGASELPRIENPPPKR